MAPHTIAVAVAALAMIAMGSLLVISPRTAALVVTEGHVVEWLQAGAFGAVAVVAFRGAPAALDLLLGLLFLLFVVEELDLHHRVFSRPVIDKRFLLNPAVPLSLRLLVMLALAALAAAVLAFVWRRRAELRRTIPALLRSPSGRVVVAGLFLLVMVEIFEKPLGRVTLPKYVLEEMLELVAALCCFGGMLERARSLDAASG